MTLELTISQNQTAISESCNNVAEIQANIQFLNIIKGEKGDKGDTPYIGLNGNWWVSGEDTGTPATGDDGVGISNCELVSTVGKVKTYRITFSNSTTFEYTLEDGSDGRGIISFEIIDIQEKTKTYRLLFTDATFVDVNIIDGSDGQDGKSAYKSAVGGGYTGTEAEFNALFNAIDGHIADNTIHHTTTELDELYEPKKGTDDNYVTDDEKTKLSNLSGVNTGDQDLTEINSHLGDATKHIDSTAELGEAINETNHSLLIWNGLKALKVTFARMKTWLSSLYLKLDQTTPQTIQGNVNVNGNVNAATTNVNQSTLPSVNASQDAAILQDGSAFTGTDYVMPTNNVAVKFVASAAHTMGDFTIRVKSSATLTSTTATLRGYLYSDSAGSPSTLLATGNAIFHGSITTSYQELSLGTQFNLVAGTTYWLVIRWSSAPTDGNIIFDSNSDTNGGATSSDATSWTLTNVRLRYILRGRTFYGINAFSTNNIGVYGQSTNNIGVYGISTNNVGVYGASTNNVGVYGASINNIGVRGISTNNIGVRGISTNNIGVDGSSTNNIGVRGISTNNRAGYFSRNTATPSAVPVVEIIQDHASDTNSVLDVKQDGTGEIARFFDSGVEVASIEKGGLGIYKKGVQIGDNTDVASYENRGATRYRENAGGSFYEMVMKKQDGSYAWVSLVSFQ